MTIQSAAFHTLLAGLPLPEAPEEEPQDLAAPAAGPPTLQCPGCGAVGTHYLTCSSLRLPSGYRFSADPELRAARHARGGPNHPDWPRPPQS